MTEKKRIFIAINVPADLKNILEAHIEPFYKEKCVRIPSRDGWHVTLVFCGYLGETEIGVLEKAVKEVVSLTPSFSLKPVTVSFAPERNPRMVWLKFKDSSEYSKLSKEFFKFADKKMLKPIPHVTLARFDPKYFHRLKNLLPDGGVDISEEARSFKVSSVEIMESHLSREGARHEALLTVNLT